jgi:hypothetical protein
MFNLRNREIIETALAIMNFPFTYSVGSAISKGYLPTHALASSGFMRLLQIFEAAQSECGNYEMPPYSKENIWTVILNNLDLAALEVTSFPICTKQEMQFSRRYSKNINLSLLDHLVSISPKSDGNEVPTENQILILSHCVWLSQLIGMCILGIATAEVNGADTIRVFPANDLARTNLRRTWFGVAFEKQSQLADEIRIQILAKSIPQQVRLASTKDMASLCFELCSKWWRLSIEHIPGNYWNEILIPTFDIFVNVVRLNEIQEQGPFTRSSAHELRIAEILFDQIVKHQASIDSIDRIFTPLDDGLILTKRDWIQGFMTLAEGLLEMRYPKIWRDIFSSSFEQHIKLRFTEEECKQHNLRVIPKDLFKHDSSTDAKLDVDLFIVDGKIGVTYAIQLKHLAHGYRPTLTDSIKWFRKHDSKLEHAVQQLKDLPRLATTDTKTKNSLLELGLQPNEIRNIYPIVIHNIGLLDCWKFKDGVALYDWHTFRQVLMGCPANQFRIEIDKEVEYESVESHLTSTANPADPESIIDQYSNDSRFQDLTYFDIAAKMSTRTSICKTIVVADGLGL